MTIRKSILALTLAMSAAYATQANAVVRADRPPPNGMNGASLTGRTDHKMSADRDVAAPKAVVLPNGSRIVVK